MNGDHSTYIKWDQDSRSVFRGTLKSNSEIHFLIFVNKHGCTLLIPAELNYGEPIQKTVVGQNSGITTAKELAEGIAKGYGVMKVVE